jgi:hypothetical protein
MARAKKKSSKSRPKAPAKAAAKSSAKKAPSARAEVSSDLRRVALQHALRRLK